MKVLTGIIAGAVTMAVIVAAYVAWLVHRGFTTQQDPSVVERVVARTVRNISIPAAARAQENPWKDLDNPDTQREARDHFASRCAMCHANDGSGKTQMGQNLYPKAPDMRMPATQQLTDGALYYIIDKGVRLTGMPAYGSPEVTQDDDTWKLVLFLRRLPKLTPEELHDMETFNPAGRTEGGDQGR